MIEREINMEDVKKKMIKIENVDLQTRHLVDDLPSPSASPPPPTASPVLTAGSPGNSPDDQNTPVMLTTMQPVPLNIMDIPKDYMTNAYVDDGSSSRHHQEFIYQVDGKNVEIVRQDDLPPGTVSVVVQQPGGLLPAYQTPGTTVLVLSELVEDIAPVR